MHACCLYMLNKRHWRGWDMIENGIRWIWMWWATCSESCAISIWKMMKIIILYVECFCPIHTTALYAQKLNGWLEHVHSSTLLPCSCSDTDWINFHHRSLCSFGIALAPISTVMDATGVTFISKWTGKHSLVLGDSMIDLSGSQRISVVVVLMHALSVKHDFSLQQREMYEQATKDKLYDDNLKTKTKA